MKAALGLAISAALALGGCCVALDDGGGTPLPAELDPEKPQPADVDLGLAVFPSTAPTARPANFRFIAPPLKPKTYRTAFCLDRVEAKGVDDSLAQYARSVSYRKEGDNRFAFKPAPGCKDDMECIYEAIAARSMADVAPLGALFKARAAAAKLDVLQAAELIVSFVQAIHYEIPKDEPFGVLPPALVLSQRRGDCDSKSLLALMLLHSIGVDAILVDSDSHSHSMLGIALPVSGTTFDYAGRRYAFTECTAVGWPIGKRDPKLASPNDWRAVPVHLPATPGAPPPAHTQGPPPQKPRTR